jgi:hypothetical protein
MSHGARREGRLSGCPSRFITGLRDNDLLIGDAVRRAKLKAYDADERQTWLLFTDSTIRMH